MKKMRNKFYWLIVLGIAVVVVSIVAFNLAKESILVALSQFPLFDFALNIVTYKTFPNLFSMDAFLNFLVELMEFIIVVFLYDWLFDYVVKLIYKPNNSLIKAIQRYPLNLFLGICVRFAIVLLISFGVYYIQKYLGPIGKALATTIIFVGASVITMLRNKDKKVIIIGLIMEALSTLGVLSLCTGIHVGIRGGANVTGIIIFGLIFVVAFGLLKSFYNFYVSD